MKCKICQEQSVNFANARILDKYDIDYFQCQNCGYVQTEEPYWLNEAYSEAIAGSDVGLALRNINFSKITSNIIFSIFNHDAKFVDYGGGYGLFVRLMRDAGFDFYWYDKFCQNIFVRGFEAEEKEDLQYELVTAFEVFEHFVNPFEEIEKILKFSHNILLSTELLPESNPKPNEWRYYSLQEGQHVSLYTSKALSIISEKLGLNFYSNGTNLHLLTKKRSSAVLFESLCYCEPPKRKKRSLIEADYLKAIGIEENAELPIVSTPVSTKTGLKIVVDGVFFQSYKTGIARLWRSLLEEWVKDGFAEYILLLDRAGTAPKISGINYLTIQPYSYDRSSVDREVLQQICDEEAADLFVSTYYTTPLSTPSLFMAYDMIPEVLGWNLDLDSWKEKHFGIRHASAYITISENTARDLVSFFPDISDKPVTVAYCGIDRNFSPATQEEIEHFRKKYCISKPYFILVGAISGYKNGVLFFQAFSQLCSKTGFEIVCTGFHPEFEEEFRSYTLGSVVHKLQLSELELKIAYSGAVALVFPSQYEGFGLPVLEAIACGCPVITSPNASIPEVAGEAAIYVNYDDVEGMANALFEVQKPAVRNFLITTGLQQAKKFSWQKMASEVRSALIAATLLPLKLKAVNLIIFPDWLQEESLYVELEAILKAMGSHPDRNQITLLIDTSNISEESEIDANLILSSILMNLLMQEELDITDGIEISLVEKLNPLQWEALLPRIQARIVLENENKQTIERVQAAGIPQIRSEDFLSFRPTIEPNG